MKINLKRQTLDRLLKDVPENERAMVALQLHDKYRHLKQQLLAIAKLEREEKERHDARVEELRKQRWTLQKSCDHPEEEYFPDPSGNNDSHRTCIVCDRDR